MNRSKSNARSRRHPAEKMISAQRRAFILDILHEHGAVSIQQLSDRMGASFSTVRRDLNHLAKDGLVVRTHGGATLQPGENLVVEEAEEAASESVNRAKIAIGAEGARGIEEGQSVILDSNLTVLEAARRIVERRLHLTTVTNGIKIATVMARAPQVRLIVLGGSPRPGSFALFGEPGYSFLGRLNADVALIGAHRAAGEWLTDSHVEIATMKQAMMRAAQRRILLIDSWKFGGVGFCEVAPLSDFDLVITDDRLPATDREILEKSGVKLKIVTVGDDLGPQWTSVAARERCGTVDDS